MISSSNFFKKTLFTIDSDEHRKKRRNQPDGPWGEQKSGYMSRSLGKHNKRYMSIDRPQQHQSNLFSQRRSLSVRKEHVQDVQTSLKFPRVNEYDLTNKIKYCLNLQGNLNFRNKGNKNGFKKLVLKPNYDFIKPRTQVYRKFIMAARKCINDCTNPNEVFYNG